MNEKGGKAMDLTEIYEQVFGKSRSPAPSRLSNAFPAAGGELCDYCGHEAAPEQLIVWEKGSDQKKARNVYYHATCLTP